MQCVKYMRIMYHVAKLVHGDLSEYNMLYYKKVLYFIDVSQSVEHDHPRSLVFLRMDCINITSYFSKNGVDNAMHPRTLFHFVTDTSFGTTDEEMDNKLEQIREMAVDAVEEDSVEAEIQDKVRVGCAVEWLLNKVVSLGELQESKKANSEIQTPKCQAFSDHIGFHGESHPSKLERDRHH